MISKLASIALTSFLCSRVAAAEAEACRDPKQQPFLASSVWNTPIGSEAEFVTAGIFNASQSPPRNFFSDDDYFFVTSASDPLTAWYKQGWWGPPSGTGHCNITGPLVDHLRFPHNVTVTAFGNNNGAGLLQPDGHTLIEMQPVYRCGPGSPILAQDCRSHCTNDIRYGNGTTGAHGGSGLSAVGGTIRLGELSHGAAAIQHALKLELYAKDYYWHAPNRTACYSWPAITCDGYALTPGQHLEYGGTNPWVRPGSLLALTQADRQALDAVLTTDPGRVVADALASYGGYLVDDTAATRGTICTEHGVTDQFKSDWDMDFDQTSGPWYDDLLAVFRKLQVVRNNGPDAVGGGGKPVQPPPPPLCPT